VKTDGDVEKRAEGKNLGAGKIGPHLDLEPHPVFYMDGPE